MRKTLCCSIVSIIVLCLPAFTYAGGKCTGSVPCNACTSCSGCKHCKSGGICGTCKPVEKMQKTPTKKTADSTKKDTTIVQPNSKQP